MNRIHLSEYGDSTGLPTVYFHGSFSNSQEASLIEDKARAAGLRILAVGRPGIWRMPWRGRYSLIQYAEEILARLRGLGIDEFGVIARGGGAPALYGLAYVAPDRIRFAIDLAGRCPMVEYSRKEPSTSIHRMAVLAANRAPWTFSLAMRLVSCLHRGGPQLVNALCLPWLCPADREWLRDKPGFLHTAMARAMAQGVAGTGWELALRYRPWGFSLREIDVPINLLHDREDAFVSVKFAKWKNSMLPKSSLRIVRGSGHLGILDDAVDIFVERRTRKLRRRGDSMRASLEA